ncbi:PPR repeat, partial [Musa troglodytarum]
MMLLYFYAQRDVFPAALDVYILLRIRFLAVMSKSYNILLKSLLRTGDKQIAKLVISEFIKIYGTFEPQMTNAMFLYLSKKNVEKAVHFLNVRCKRIISVSALTMVIDTFKKEGYLERALDLCGSMKRKGIYPNVVIYNSVIDGLCQQGCLTETFRIFYSLENLFYASYNCYLFYSYREGFLDDPSQLFKRMIIKGVIPNTSVFNKLITADWLKKPWISSQIWKRIVYPDDYTIVAILNGFCKRGDIEGALEGLFAKRRSEEARSILRDMLKHAEIVDLINNDGDELHVESLDSLLSLACEQRRIKEVILVLNEISYLSITSTRSNSGRVFLKLKELHGSGVLDTENNIDGRGAHRLLVADVHGTNIKGGFIVKEDEDSDKEINEYLMGKLGYDFATYYSIISLLCQREDLQKANKAARTILQNPEK